MTMTPACKIGSTAVTLGVSLMALRAAAVSVLDGPGVGLSSPSSLGLGAAADTEMPASAPPWVIWLSTLVRPVSAIATSAVSMAVAKATATIVNTARPGRRASSRRAMEIASRQSVSPPPLHAGHTTSARRP